MNTTKVDPSPVPNTNEIPPRGHESRREEWPQKLKKRKRKNLPLLRFLSFLRPPLFNDAVREPLVLYAAKVMLFWILRAEADRHSPVIHQQAARRASQSVAVHRSHRFSQISSRFRQ